MTRIVKKPEERRREIVAASRMLFLEHDYETTTMQDVMTHLQIAKGTAYHYFKSKAELLDAVVQDMVEEYVAGVQEAVAECEGGAMDKMRTLVFAGQLKAEKQKTLDALHRPGNSVLHTKLLAETVTRLALLYRDVIVQGCKEKLFQTGFPLECAEFIIAGVQFLTDMGIYNWSAEELARRRKAFPRLVEQLLRAPKGSFKMILRQ